MARRHAWTHRGRSAALLVIVALILGALGGVPAEALCRPGGGRVGPVPQPLPIPDPGNGGDPDRGSPGDPTTEPSGRGPWEPPSTDPRTPGSGDGPVTGGGRRPRPRTQAKADWSWTTWWAFSRWDYLPGRNAMLRRHFLRFRTITGEQDDAFRAWDGRRDKLAMGRATPALIALMTGDLSPGDEGLRAAAALALARTANTAVAVAAVMKAAEDRKASDEVREAATFAAGLFRRTDPERRMRPAQTEALRRRLFALADDATNSRNVRCLALLAIGMLGDQPSEGSLPQGMREIRGLWKRLMASDQGAETHVAYLTALGLEPAASTGDTIRGALKDIVLGKRFAKRRWNEHERSHALCTLVRLGGPAWRPVLTRLFAQRQISAEVRRAAFITLGDKAAAYSEEERKDLVRAWDGAMKHVRDPLTRGLGLIALGRILAVDLQEPEGGRLIRTTPAASILLREIRSAPQTTRGFAVLALALAAREASGADRVIVRFRADAEQALLQGLERSAGNAASQGPYAVAAGLLGAKAAIPTLEALVVDSNVEPQLRGFAAVALGQIGRAGPSTVRALKRAVADYRLGTLRLEAALGLAYLTGDRDSAFLREDIERRRYTHSHEIGHVAIALGQMGDLRAIEPLCGLVLDPKSDHGARGAAAVALGLLCDPEEQPSLARLWQDVNYPARSVALHMALNYL